MVIQVEDLNSSSKVFDAHLASKDRSSREKKNSTRKQ